MKNDYSIDDILAEIEKKKKTTDNDFSANTELSGQKKKSTNSSKYEKIDFGNEIENIKLKEKPADKASKDKSQAALKTQPKKEKGENIPDAELRKKTGGSENIEQVKPKNTEKSQKKDNKGKLPKPTDMMMPSGNVAAFTSKKKTEEDVSITQILNTSDEHKASGRKNLLLSVTQIIGGSKPKKNDFSVTQIIGDSEKLDETTERKEKITENDGKSISETVVSDGKHKKDFADKPTVTDNEEKPKAVSKAETSAKQGKKDKKLPRPAAITEHTSEVEIKEEMIVPESDENEESETTNTFEITDEDYSFLRRNAEEERKSEAAIEALNKKSEKAQELSFTAQISQSVGVEVAKIKEDKERERQRRLEKDIRLQAPDELLDAINPYEQLDKTATMKKSREKSDAARAAVEESENVHEYFSGDTIGVAGNELKAMSSGGKKAEGDTAEVTEYHIKGGDALYSKRARAYGITGSDEKRRRSNTALIESLNKALADKRNSDIEVQKNLSLTGGFTSSIQIPTSGLNIDYDKQVIMDTGGIARENPVLAEEEMKELSSKRKRKIRDFVMEDVEDEELEDEDYEDNEEEVFSGEDSAAQIWNDLCESHRSLKMRFIILLIVTLVLVICGFLNDFTYDARLNLFGMTVDFFDRRFNSEGYIYLNLICGIIGMAVCSGAIINGIAKLFKGKADCDSICAVSATASIICAAVNLINHDSLTLGNAYLFISVGLCALLANTVGKIVMIVRAKRNFRFICDDGNRYYVEKVADENDANIFTKGTVTEIPVLATMRKTEFLTDFLRNSYCTDKADKVCRIITPLALAAAVVLGVLAYVIPTTDELTSNIYWAVTVFTAALSALAPFSIMFMVNSPLNRVSKELSKGGCTVLGYESANYFKDVNSVLLDANLLFPAGSVIFKNLKRCQQANSLINIEIDQAIILAASLAIESNSVLSYMFFDMIGGKNELLTKVDNCIYEDNMGVMGWVKNKRVMLGNREQMKHHGIKVPSTQKERKYCRDNEDILYLAVGGETVTMFFVETQPNSEVLSYMKQLTDNGISVIVRANDALVTVNKLSDEFEISPDMLRVIPYSLHEKFAYVTKYTSKGNGGISCRGTFTSMARALIACKKLIKDFTLSSEVTFAGMFIAAIILAGTVVSGSKDMITASNIIMFNTAWLGLMLIIQRFRRY